MRSCTEKSFAGVFFAGVLLAGVLSAKGILLSEWSSSVPWSIPPSDPPNLLLIGPTSSAKLRGYPWPSANHFLIWVACLVKFAQARQDWSCWPPGSSVTMVFTSVCLSCWNVFHSKLASLAANPSALFQRLSWASTCWCV
jgi:hypothetical protein